MTYMYIFNKNKQQIILINIFNYLSKELLTNYSLGTGPSKYKNKKTVENK